MKIREGKVVISGRGDATLPVSPVELAQRYAESGADELLFYDVTANTENKALFTELLKNKSELLVFSSMMKYI